MDSFSVCVASFVRKVPAVLTLSVLLLCLCLCSVLYAETVIHDSDNRIISFDHPFSRIISLYPAHTANLFSLGLDSEIIGISVGCSDMPDAADRPLFSYRDDPERLLAARPDLVLVRPMISRSHPAFVKMLEANGVTVVSLQPVSVSGLYEYWRTLGRLTGRVEAAEAMCVKFRREIEKLRKKVSDIPQEKRKKVYFESIHRRMKTFAPGSIAMFVLETAGGINVMSGLSSVRNTNIADCGKERIVAHADEIDVYLAQYGRMNRVTVEEIINEPGFQVIRAVKDRQVYLVDEKLVSRPAMTVLEGVRQVMHILYGIR